MLRRYGRIVTASLLILLALAGCGGPGAQSIEPTPAPTPAPTQAGATAAQDAVPADTGAARISASVYTDYYMSGWVLEFDGGVIRADAPDGTGSARVDAYIRRDEGEESMLTPYMGAFSTAYLSGEWLYFSCADEEEGVFDTGRVNINLPEEPELLGIFHLFATKDYFYYCKGEGISAVDYSVVYRRDADFANETAMPFGMNFMGALYPAGDKVLSFREDASSLDNTVITVYDQQGAALYDVPVNSRATWSFYADDGAFYWCDFGEMWSEPAHTYIHRVDLQDGGRTEAIEFAADVEGWVVGVVDADDQWIYVKVSIPFPEGDYQGPFDNILLYRMPAGGGEPEVVRSWFES